MKILYPGILLGSLAIALCTPTLQAQVKTKIFDGGVPTPLVSAKRAAGIERRIAAPPDFNALRQKAARLRSHEADRKFALPVPVNIDLLKEGSVSINGGSLTYVLRVHAEDALNLSLQFKNFRLSEHALLSIFTDHELTDSITAANANNKKNIWATRVYQGNQLFVALKVPVDEVKECSVRISGMGFGFRPYGVSPEFGNPGASAACNVNVVCAAGTGWENERNSVGLIVSLLGEWCSGALIMNTCGSRTPYFLTADHCLDGDQENWVFQFLTFSTICTPNGTYREDLQFNGCTLRANSAATDFALLELDQTPAPASGIRYAGWSRNTAGITQTTILHHPAGDLMKVSRDNQGPSAVTVSSKSCWQLGLDLGATEGGSSGAPYFNQDHRIIAQHWASYPAATCLGTKLGGRFDLSWTGGGTNATRLSNWLDAAASNAMTTNTTNVANLVAPVGTLSFTGGYTLCGATMPLTVTTLGSAYTGPVNWTSSNPAVATVTPSGNPATITRVGNGYANITATIPAGCGGTSQTLSRNIEVSSVPATPVITYTKSTTTDYVFTASATGTPVGFDWFIDGTQRRWNADAVTYWTIPCYQSISIYARQTNACGSSAYSSPLNVYNWCTLSALHYTVYPNPANNTVTIEPAVKSTQKVHAGKMTTETSHGINAIRVFDGLGNIRKEVRVPHGSSKAQINVQGLQPGVYYLEISDGKNVERQKLVVVGN